MAPRLMVQTLGSLWRVELEDWVFLYSLCPHPDTWDTGWGCGSVKEGKERQLRGKPYF